MVKGGLFERISEARRERERVCVGLTALRHRLTITAGITISGPVIVSSLHSDTHAAELWRNKSTILFALTCLPKQSTIAPRDAYLPCLPIRPRWGGDEIGGIKGVGKHLLRLLFCPRKVRKCAQHNSSLPISLSLDDGARINREGLSSQ
uniref:Uncharacterized protein n=1 Tax=Anopheles albimanus TaxID=7167 RepID=A0A182FCP4_ANOAL